MLYDLVLLRWWDLSHGANFKNMLYIYMYIPSLMLQRGAYETKTPVFTHHLDTVFPLLLVASQCGKSSTVPCLWVL